MRERLDSSEPIHNLQSRTGMAVATERERGTGRSSSRRFRARSGRAAGYEAVRRGTGRQGRPSYPPQLMLKIWLYAYMLGITSSRRIEQRIQEDLGFRLLAGNLKPDHWTLNQFRKRH